jgi:hypothetical protein
MKNRLTLFEIVTIVLAIGFGIAFAVQTGKVSEEQKLNLIYQARVANLESELQQYKPDHKEVESRREYLEKMVTQTVKSVDELNASEWPKYNSTPYTSRKSEFYNECTKYIINRLYFYVTRRMEFEDQLNTLLGQWRDLRIDPHITK